MKPETRYARSGDVSVAYQVLGEGPIDLVCAPGLISHVEHMWERPTIARFHERLASFSRLIIFDKRGTGASDPVATIPTLEDRMDDERAVMDATGSERAALFGVSEGATFAALFAATYPGRTRALITYAALIRMMWAPDWTCGITPDFFSAFQTWAVDHWGQEGSRLGDLEPELAADPSYPEWWARYQRLSASPGMVKALLEMNGQIDIRHVLPTISAPTLILHRQNDLIVNIEQSRYMARVVPGSRYVELPGQAHVPFMVAAEDVLHEIEEFLTGTRSGPDLDRVLATVLYTDIVGSTDRLASVGDRRWVDLLDAHNELAKREISRFRGRTIKSTGDGFLAIFDGPGRAVRCAQSIGAEIRKLGIEMKAGLHCGECELLGDDVGGIAVHIAARVVAQARPGEVLVSSTVKDLVAGSGLEFEQRGSHTLKGVPDEWELFAAKAS